MPRCCLKCEKELTIGKSYTYTDLPEVYEVEIHTLCNVCTRIERIKDEKKIRELTKRQKNLEEIQHRRFRQYQLENEYLYFLKSQE
jgi:hypothetical protein